MTIWIFAIILIASVAVTGWRQGAIRAAFSFGGILFGLLLAPLVGRIFHWVLPHIGVVNPIYVWALSPILGFIVVSIAFKVAAFKVHTNFDVYYRYKAGDLRLGLWKRLNARLGICVGLLNGACYFLIISFLIFNFSYWTAQAATEQKPQSMLVGLVNRMGADLGATGMARPASALYTLSPSYYQLADLTGLLVQNLRLAPRVANYPGLTSLWQRDDMQSLVTDGNLTNFLASDATLIEISNEGPVQDMLKDHQLTGVVLGAVTNNLADFENYLNTGKSAKYDGQPILGSWTMNVGVSLAWLRQAQPKMQPAEIAAVRAIWTKAYSQTRLLVTGDNQVFIYNLPQFKAKAGEAPDMQTWKGTCAADGQNFAFQLTLNGQDKFMEATPGSQRLTVKDGHNLLIFDAAN